MRKDGFALRENRGIPYYSCAAFESLPWLRHGFSTRRGGVAAANGNDSLNLNAVAWDEPGRVEENRRRFLHALGLDAAVLATLNQVHSTTVRVLGRASTPWVATEGDALVTREPNVALGVKTADCLPVLIADPATKAVGAVHSGWRGTLEGVLERAVGEMLRNFGGSPDDLLVAVGPGIRACCFEVGGDVADLFLRAHPGAGAVRAHPGRPGKHLVDLVKVLDAQLDRLGVPPGNRHDSGLCSCCDTREFFSWRAEGAASGRMMSVVAIA
ncbi:MAG: peptidoglycan editing factor PgeF [Acidobacteriota bacterium]|jgi:YfiH family protein|nr:peptidoglycan editing factor PgeF [Acidobacteriota bacterium]